MDSDAIVIGEQWVMGKKIGSGSFGEIYLGEHIKTKERVAIKLEHRRKSGQLSAEYEVTRKMDPKSGFPETKFYGVSGEYRIMVMELLGVSLETCFQECGQSFSLKTILMLGEQLLNRLELLHKQNYVHCDLKPDNFLIGRGANINQVYLIDFGLARPYSEPNTGHIEYVQHNYLRGTARYASINAHRGTLSRRDDIESLCYVLFYFYRKVLPWQGLPGNTTQEKYQRIMEKKISTPLDELCEDMPPEFKAMVAYSRNLEFKEEPNYGYLRSLFHNVARREGITFDYVYDWMESEPEVKVAPPKQPRASISSLIPMNGSTTANHNGASSSSRRVSRARPSDFGVMGTLPEFNETAVL